MNIIDLPPIAPTLIESTRAIGYSLEAAVADIIDNSIAAGATKVDISFFPVGDAYIAILDNGRGMRGDELTTAMQYGSQSPQNRRSQSDLGRFGLGLKTASLSQCRMLTVASKAQGRIEVRRWDIDYVQKTGAWSLILLTDSNEISDIPNIQDLEELQSGTLVVWQKLDRMKAGIIDFEQSMGREIDRVRDHLSLVYHRYLSGEKGIQKLNITINNTEIEPADPFLIRKSEQPMQEEILKVRDSEITVQPYILPHASKLTADELKKVGGEDGLRKQQGFYVYRNKRLLVWGTWFRMMRKGELTKLARIRVDIPNTLDDLWTLDIKKSSAMPPEEVRQNLQSVIEKIGERSTNRYRVRGRKETDTKEIHLWNRMKDRTGGIYYEINRDHPFVKLVAESTSDSRMFDTFLKQIEKNLPLNQLYIDLCGDEKITNEQEQKNSDIENTLRKMLPPEMPKDAKLAVLTQIETIPPYDQYPKIFEKLKGEL